jgi:GT2 family glycosyltransferase
VPLAAFRPRAATYRAPFVDGTCMFVPASTIDRLGLLDAEAFTPLGWGAEIDYCLRARDAGLTVAVTQLAYLHHKRAVTAQAVFGDYDAYLANAYPPALEALHERWGDWERLAEVELPAAQTRPLDPASRLERSGRRAGGLRRLGRRRP